MDKMICVECGATEQLTKHHGKDYRGIPTGEIQSLCRLCHDNIELQYCLDGRLGKKRKVLILKWIK